MEHSFLAGKTVKSLHVHAYNSYPSKVSLIIVILLLTAGQK